MPQEENIEQVWCTVPDRRRTSAQTTAVAMDIQQLAAASHFAIHNHENHENHEPQKANGTIPGPQTPVEGQIIFPENQSSHLMLILGYPSPKKVGMLQELLFSAPFFSF